MSLKMKNLLQVKKTKWLIFIAFLGIVAAYSCRTHYPLAGNNFTATKNPSSFEHGKNLVYNVCGGCHYNHQLNKFAGHQLRDLPGFLGTVYSANLTQSKMYGVTTHYTDAQLAYLIKTGIKKDGRFIPYMIRPTMADEDINDIIVYLRSDDAAVAAADTSVGKTHLSLIGKMANHTQKPQPYITGIKRPSPEDAVANGRYLVDILGCYHCHSKSIQSLKYQHPEQSKGYMQGGMKFKTLEGQRVRAANLTPDVKTGIGSYSKEDFKKALKEGETPDARTLRFPMPKFKDLTDKQVDEIYAYLRTLPPKAHEIK
jgi:hypothetical protein